MGVGIEGDRYTNPRNQNRNGWQAGGTHSTGMFSCLSVFGTLKCSRCKNTENLADIFNLIF